jgi:hypothetical protein
MSNESLNCLPQQSPYVNLSIEYFPAPKEAFAFMDKNQNPGAKALIGPIGQPLKEEISAWLKRHNHVFHFRFSADDTYFYPVNPARVWDRPLSEENLNAWIKSVIEWTSGVFGEKDMAVYYNPPKGENESKSPSIGLWIGEEEYKRSTIYRRRSFWPNALKKYGRAMAHLGLIAPKPPIRPPVDVGRYYKANNSPESPKPIEERELKKFVRLPDWTPERGSSESYKKYESEAIALTLENAVDLLKEYDFHFMATSAELERRKHVKYLYRKNATLFSEKVKKLYPLVEPFLGVTAASALVFFLKATLVSDDPKDQDYYVPPDKGLYRLKDGRLIEVDCFDWREPATGLSGTGAINLIESLSEYDERGAIVGLLGYFTVKETMASLAYHEAFAPKDRTTEILGAPFELPKTMESTWPPVRAYLMDEFKLPAKVLDEAHETGRLLTNHIGLMIFPCDRDAGMFYMFRQKMLDKLPEVGSPWGDCPPFVLKGSGGPIYLTDHPLEALALKSLYPESSIIAVGDKSTAESVRPYVTGQKAILAVRPKPHGHRLARQLKELNLPIYKVPSGQSFTEYWRNEARGQ